MCSWLCSCCKTYSLDSVTNIRPAATSLFVQACDLWAVKGQIYPRKYFDSLTLEITLTLRGNISSFYIRWILHLKVHQLIICTAQ